MKRINFNKITKKKERKIKIKEPKEKIRKNKGKKLKISGKVFKFLIIAVITFAIIGILGAIGFGFYIVKGAPEFDPDKLYEREASVIYDSENILRATLGVERREKVSYGELPNVLVDAIVATEDSRFFQHNGFDLPRFLKASFGQFLGNSDAGGGSTITMQVSKNSFTSKKSEGIQGIIRKFTDIYMSIFQIEKKYTKEEILEFYVNYPWLGSNSWGVEQASLTYFDKSIRDLSLPEAALIAGLFQAPGSYDPYIYPEKAEARRNQVLNLMLRHGYISKKECDTAKKISVESMLRKNYNVNTNPYQGFIETVVQAIRDELKLDPYQVPMEIHATMVASKQDAINDLYNGNLGYTFKDDKIDLGVAVIDNKTGAILAVGTGRNKTREFSFNFATQTKNHPGSTAKPIFDYGPGIEYMKWSTYTPFFDEPTTYSSGKSMGNSDGKYTGMQSLKTCLAKSRNTCALQAFQKLDNEKIYEFVTSLGITPELVGNNKYINEAHSVGGFTGVSPVQLAGAYSAFASGGYYTKPYSYTKIIFRETGEVIEPEIKRERVMSAQTAYLITTILTSATSSSVKVSGTQIATKTGTSSYDSDFLKSLGLSSSVIRDSWISSYSPDYTLTFWYGYGSGLTKESAKAKYYNTMSSSSTERVKMQAKLAALIMEKNSKFNSPGGITSSQVELGTIPAQLPSSHTPSDLIETHLFISGTEPTEVSSRFSTLANPTNLTIGENLNNVHAEWSSPGTPSAIDKDYLLSYFNNSYGNYAGQYYNYRIAYNDAYIGKFGYEVYLAKGTNLTYVGWTENTSYDIDLSKYTNTFDSVIVKSAYSIFKNNKSSGVTGRLGSYSADKTLDIVLSGSWKGTDPSVVSSVKVDNVPTLNYDVIKVEIKDIKKNNVSVPTNYDVGSNKGEYVVKYEITIKANGTTFPAKAITLNITIN